MAGSTRPFAKLRHPIATLGVVAAGLLPVLACENSRHAEGDEASAVEPPPGSDPSAHRVPAAYSCAAVPARLPFAACGPLRRRADSPTFPLPHRPHDRLPPSVPLPTPLSLSSAIYTLHLRTTSLCLTYFTSTF